MNAKHLMQASAFFTGILGIVLVFMPDEVARYVDHSSAGIALAYQLLGALYFGFAMLNWMAKGLLLGGIYGRPIVVANFSNYTIGAFALIREAFSGAASPVIILAVFYAVLAFSFGLLMFKHPGNKAT